MENHKEQDTKEEDFSQVLPFTLTYKDKEITIDLKPSNTVKHLKDLIKKEFLLTGDYKLLLDRKDSIELSRLETIRLEKLLRYYKTNKFVIQDNEGIQIKERTVANSNSMYLSYNESIPNRKKNSLFLFDSDKLQKTKNSESIKIKKDLNNSDFFQKFRSRNHNDKEALSFSSQYKYETKHTLDSLRDILKSKTQEFESLHRQINTLSNENRELNSEIKQLKEAKIPFVLHRLTSSTEPIETKNTIRNDILDIVNEIKQLKNSFEELEQRCFSAEQERDKALKQNSLLLDYIQTINKEIPLMKNKTIRLQEELSNMKAFVEVLESKRVGDSFVNKTSKGEQIRNMIDLEEEFLRVSSENILLKQRLHKAMRTKPIEALSGCEICGGYGRERSYCGGYRELSTPKDVGFNEGFDHSGFNKYGHWKENIRNRFNCLREHRQVTQSGKSNPRRLLLNNEGSKNQYEVNNLKKSTPSLSIFYKPINTDLILSCDLKSKALISLQPHYPHAYSYSNDSIYLNTKLQESTRLLILTGPPGEIKQLYSYQHSTNNLTQISHCRFDHTMGRLLKWRDQLLCLSGKSTQMVEVSLGDHWRTHSQMKDCRINGSYCITNGKFLWAFFGYSKEGISSGIERVLVDLEDDFVPTWESVVFKAYKIYAFRFCVAFACLDTVFILGESDYVGACVLFNTNDSSLEDVVIEKRFDSLSSRFPFQEDLFHFRDKHYALDSMNRLHILESVDVKNIKYNIENLSIK